MSRPRILVVEDDPEIQKLIATTLSEKDHDLLFVDAQDAAYAALESESFDTVLLDLRLPVSAGSMEQSRDVGLDALKEIRDRQLLKRRTSAPLPVVVMTAFSSEDVAVEVLRLPCVDYLRKPFKAKVLRSVVCDACFGRGTFAPNLPHESQLVRLAIHSDASAAQIETLPAIRGQNFTILEMLAELFREDVESGRDPKAYRKLRAAELAHRLNVNEASVFTRVNRFRDRLSRDFQQHLLRDIDRSDVIENKKGGGGYRLNPATIRLVSVDVLPLR